MFLFSLFIVLTFLVIFGLIISIVKVKSLKTDGPFISKHLKEQMLQIEQDKSLNRIKEIDARRDQFQITEKLDELKYKNDIKKPTIPFWIIVVFLFIFPSASWYLYFFIGSPIIPDFPFEKRELIMENFQEQIKEIQSFEDKNLSKEISEMIINLESHLQKNPGDILGWKKLGRSKLALGLPKEAQKAYVEARKIDYYDIEALEGEATAALSLSDINKPLPSDVVALFMELLKLQDDNTLALLIVAESRAKEGKIQESKNLFNRLLSVIPENVDQRKLILDKMKELKIPN